MYIWSILFFHFLPLIFAGMALYKHIWSHRGFPHGTGGKEPACQCKRCKRHGFDPWVRKIPCRRAWQPTPVFLAGESHEQRSLVGYSPQGHKESVMTERLSTTNMMKLKFMAESLTAHSPGPQTENFQTSPKLLLLTLLHSLHSQWSRPLTN